MNKIGSHKYHKRQVHKYTTSDKFTNKYIYILQLAGNCKKLVTDEEFREVSDDFGRLSDGQRNGKLLDIVAKKGADAFDLFVSALKEEEKHLGHESLAKRLEKEKELVSQQPTPQLHGHRRVCCGNTI